MGFTERTINERALRSMRLGNHRSHSRSVCVVHRIGAVGLIRVQYKDVFAEGMSEVVLAVLCVLLHLQRNHVRHLSGRLPRRHRSVVPTIAEDGDLAGVVRLQTFPPAKDTRLVHYLDHSSRESKELIHVRAPSVTSIGKR